MSANIPFGDKPRQLDRPREPNENVQPEDTADAHRLARLLMRILRNVASLLRRWWPHRLDFEDVPVGDDGTTQIALPHRLNGRVRWWVVDWTASAAPSLRRHDASDANTLVLVSDVEGVATIRVEEAG